ncbi:carbon storage regulator CsrA [Neorhodopirellula lusitana]|uniref:carbon storage regulator CsrA n=1 Tax=Neorhodopirellula lusitana TaxID=445327 RepID=UPI00384E6135
MLVLTRKINEQIKIGNDITITIIKLRNNQVRIGIDAPREVRVIRGELETGAVESATAKGDTKPAAKSPKSTQPVASASSAPTNRMTAYIDVDMTPEEAAQTFSQAASQIRNPIVDGMMSADEVIAQAESEKADATVVEEVSPSLKIISGKVRTTSRQSKTNLRAPLSDFFSAT